GKMGYSIAEQLNNLGAEVTLVSGPTALETPVNVQKIAVRSANDMLLACQQYAKQADIIVMSAAVADYTPVEVADKKIKKKQEEFSIDLKKTTDILALLGSQKQAHQTLVGFALETDNELQHAQEK